MRLLQLIGLLTLPILTLGAKKTTEDRFANYRAKSQSTGQIKLNDGLYKELTTAPRDYSVAVLMTAMDPKYKCGLCREFGPEWDVLSRSWTKGDKTGESRLLFGVLDFADGKSTFQQLMLNTAPVIFLFRPTTGPHAEADPNPVRFEFTGPHSSEALHQWVSRHLPDRPHPPIVRPINWVRGISITTGVVGSITAVTVAAPYIMPLLQSRNLWAAVSLLGILLFTSGFMFNHIRKVPYAPTNKAGQISYFAAGFQNQYGLETQIIAVVYGALSFATIALALKVPRTTDPKAQQVAVFLWTGFILTVYSFLMSAFRIKNGSYPFFLPPF
jgi:oligosaccharyltransferase complex subunit gamma